MQEKPLPHTGEAVDWWLKRWDRDGVLSGEEPMSRNDVDGLIKANGGTAEGLDLTFRNLQSANLSEMNLREARLQGADLGHTDLREADLFRADLQEADLFRTDLRGAFLMQADLRSAYILAIRVDEQTNLEDVDWEPKYVNVWEQIHSYQNARATYRQLKNWHHNHGHYDIAGEFQYRGWVCKRREALEQVGTGLSWRHPLRTLQALKLQRWFAMVAFLWLITHELLFGYGERPIRVVLAASVIILGFALVFFLFPISNLSTAGPIELSARLLDSLYFSLVSFTTLGYGGWVNHPDNWLRYLGGFESFIGLFLSAIFLVTFTRKWTQG